MSLRTGQLKFAGKEMYVFLVWHGIFAITVDKIPHGEQIQEIVDFIKVCWIELIGIQKAVDRAREGGAVAELEVGEGRLLLEFSTPTAAASWSW